MAARVAYFKNLNQAAVDADQATAILTLGSRVSAVESGKADASAVADKADVAYVMSAVGAVDAKVDTKLDATAAAGFATASALLQKADILYVEGQINGLAALKADASVVQGLSSEVSSHTGQLIGLGQQVANKQDASSASQRVAAENALFEAIKASIHIDSATPGVEYSYEGLGLSA